MTTTPNRTRTPERTMQTKYYLVGAAALLALQVAVLHGFGQPFISASGRILLWVNDPLSPETSQQLADWYSFSHLIHGMILFWLLRWLAPGWPLPVRQQALAVGYVGDSILNSLSDSAMMSCGFWLASRLGGHTVM